ncbi:MAG TPA: DUF1552 domain-containing protein, partial [Polyangiaceae bacterium]|nr:DUF1552 domain-containing protein [Polyangiaceae bacterium]
LALGSGPQGGAGNAVAASALGSPRSRVSGRPLRFVAVYTPHGRAHELWQPREGFDLRFPDSILRPFDDAEAHGKTFRDRVLVLDGIDLSAGIASGTSGHDGPRVILTGSGADGRNASIDQYLAVERGLGAETPHTSVVLGVGNGQPEIGACISYGPGGTPIPKCIDPAQTFSDLFGVAIAGAQREELDRQRRLGKSVLDVVRADLTRLASRAPPSEKTKMDQHQAALRDIEKRLAGVERTCPAPVPPDRTHFAHVGSYDGGARYLDAISDLQVDLLARAIACDLTRFGSLFLGDLSRTHMFPDLPDDVHSDVAHRYDARDGGRPGTPATWSTLGVQNRYSYSKVARLLERLDEAGALDDTIVYVSGDMGDPARHSSRCVPTIIAGGCGGHFKMGRYVDLRRDTGAGGVPNNRLLVSICQAFGVDIPRFGHAADPRIVTGRLDALDA